MRRSISLAALALMLWVTPAAWAGPEEEIRALFGRFVAAQNARDLGAVRDLLWDSPRFLWITRGTAIWGREATLKRFDAVFQGSWRLEPSLAELQVTMFGNDAGQLYVPILFTTGPAGQPGQSERVLMNQAIVRTPAGWKVASMLPVPVVVQAAGMHWPLAAVGR